MDKKKHKKYHLNEAKDESTISKVPQKGLEEPAMTMTAAELDFQRRREERLLITILQRAEKSHKQKITEFNLKMESLTEHFDIPKISWTK